MNQPTTLPLPHYDLHTHTTCSDGALTPQELVARAAAQGVTVLAITDHDTVAGLAAAAQAIAHHSLALTLINGVELSTCWANQEIHIVGLNFDPTHPQLTAFLQQQQARRRERAVQIAQRLSAARIAGAEALVEAYHRQGKVVTRAHFAAHLCAQGYGTTPAQIFKHFLSRGKTGYVPARWSEMADAVAAIQAAGGQAVLAHPGRYGLSNKWLKRLLNDFCTAGGDALEVASGQQAPQEREKLAYWCAAYGLLASQGSDFHQPCRWRELGSKLTLPATVRPIWSVW